MGGCVAGAYTFGEWLTQRSVTEGFITRKYEESHMPLPESTTNQDTTTQLDQAVYQAARTLYQTHSDWVDFYRQVLGVHGLVRQHYRSREALAEFERTEAYAEIQQMVTRLRERGAEGPANEPTRVITVRLPRSMHDALREEAHEHRTSMNKLCISKLLQFIDNDLVPSDTPRDNEEEKTSEVDM